MPDANFPVIDAEIGDTVRVGRSHACRPCSLCVWQWIYGVASDPAKTREMRVINALRSECLEAGECTLADPRVQSFSLLALKTLEHTVRTRAVLM